jgi:predicted HAD superfamily phosphohydrolase YqeG
VSGVATGSSSFATFLQVAPRLLTVMRRMRPTWHLPSLDAVDAAFVARHGVRGIIWDVDGTLTGDRQALLEPQAEPAFRALLALPGLGHVVLSNAGEERYRQLGEMFPDVPILRGYTLGRERLYRRLFRGADTWTAAELAERLAAGARVIRKPSAELVDYAVRELGCPREAVVMIGDQFLTDVAGANLAGVRSVKLPTLAPRTFRPAVRLSQRVEALVYALFY